MSQPGVPLARPVTCNLGGGSRTKSRVVLRGPVRYTNQTGSPLLVRLGDRGHTFIPQAAGGISAPQTHFHAGHHGRRPDHLDNHQDQK